MNPFGSCLKHLVAHRLPTRSLLRSLQAAGVGLLLLALPVGATANAAAPATGTTGAHVYLLRGVLNIFSLGLDEIASKLQAQGIPATVVDVPLRTLKQARVGRRIFVQQHRGRIE